MGKYVEILDYLIELKKTKKDPNVIERKKFIQAWTEMVNKEGYIASEEYLYNGFTYCGASPLKEYIGRSKDSMEALNEFFRGKMYNKNCAGTVPILFNLLALYLNDDNVNIQIVNKIVSKIPVALKNKEGKIYGQADRALRTYFLYNLRCDKIINFELLIEKGLDRKIVEQFSLMMFEISIRAKKIKLSKKAQNNLDLLREWVKPYLKEDGQKKTNKKQIVEKDKIESENITQTEEKGVYKNETEIKDDVGQGAIDDIKLRSIEKELANKDKELIVVKEQLNKIIVIRDSQRDTIQRLQTKMLNLEAEIEKINNSLDEKNIKISELNQRISDNMDIIQKLESSLSYKDNELKEKSRMMEALSRDRAKQADEMVNRLASKLKVEYRDFTDAVGIPMDKDLGENMREQLRNVFDILIKSGVSIQD